MASPPLFPHPRRRALLGLPMLLGLGMAGCVSAPRTAGRSGEVAPFSVRPDAGELPAGWAPYVLRRDLPHTEYRTAVFEGRRVLHAVARNACSGLQCEVEVDPRTTPRLRWSWRTEAVPASADVQDGDADDAPARLVLGFDGDPALLPMRERAFFDFVELITGQRLPHATLMYVWDSRVPVGTVVRNARTSRIRYLVVESGPARARQWLHYERDLLADFRHAFRDEEPGTLRTVGILTDSDDLKIELQTWYGDIALAR